MYAYQRTYPRVIVSTETKSDELLRRQCVIRILSLQNKVVAAALFSGEFIEMKFVTVSYKRKIRLVDKNENIRLRDTTNLEQYVKKK